VLRRPDRGGGRRCAQQQDAAFGLRQLADIAVKALSPGINDHHRRPRVGHMADLLVELTDQRLDPTLHQDSEQDSEGVGRVVVPGRDLAYYLKLACEQIRRYGRHEPTVLTTLPRMVRDVSVATRDNDQRAQAADQTDLITPSCPPHWQSTTSIRSRTWPSGSGRHYAARPDLLTGTATAKSAPSVTSTRDPRTPARWGTATEQNTQQHKQLERS
jgi:Predicted membrane protein (DUF2254)